MWVCNTLSQIKQIFSREMFQVIFVDNSSVLSTIFWFSFSLLSNNGKTHVATISHFYSPLLPLHRHRHRSMNCDCYSFFFLLVWKTSWKKCVKEREGERERERGRVKNGNIVNYIYISMYVLFLNKCLKLQKIQHFQQTSKMLWSQIIIFFFWLSKANSCECILWTTISREKSTSKPSQRHL